MINLDNTINDNNNNNHHKNGHIFQIIRTEY